MRHIYQLIFAFSILSFVAQAQPYGNEWIDYSKTYYKVRIAQDGMYRIPYSTLTNSGFPTTLNGSHFALFRNGSEVPIYVTNNSTGFTTGDYIEFYGKKNDGALDANLYEDADWQLNPYVSLFNDTSIYFLVLNPGAVNERMQTETNDLSLISSLGLTPLSFFMHHELKEYHGNFGANNNYNYGVPISSSEGSIYSGFFTEGEGYADADFTTSKTYTIATPAVATGTGQPLSIKMTVLGKSINPHHLTIALNGNTLIDTSFNGYALKRYLFEPSALNSSNSILLTASGSGGVDRHAVSSIEIIYPRQFDFGNTNKFALNISGSANYQYLSITNINSGGGATILYDLKDKNRYTGSTSSPFQFVLIGTAFGSRDLFLAAENNVTTITSNLSSIAFTDFTNSTNQGDYIIISHPSLYDDGSGNNYVDQYGSYRESAQGGNYQSVIASIEELYDQFGYGVRKSPLAIRNFTQYAIDNWSVLPEFLFVIGKGREYNVMRPGGNPYNRCLIPTFGVPASDNMLSADLGDRVPKLATGRLSARSWFDVMVYLNKMLEYEANQQNEFDPNQTLAEKQWMKQIIHLGGGTDNQQQIEFKNYLEGYESLLEDTSYGGNIHAFYKTSTDPIVLIDNDNLTQLINDGVSIINFFGHSSTGAFDFDPGDPATYQNQGKYFFMCANGCFSGNIFTPDTTTSEEFVLTPDKAAIAYMSTIGLSISYGLDAFTNIFYEHVSGDLYNEPIGKCTQQTINDVQTIFNGSIYTLLITEEMTLHGDPALKLNTHNEPDYVIEPQMISFIPPIVTTGMDTFSVQMIVTNLGEAINDSINVNMTRIFPDGTQFGYTKKIKATLYQDTVEFKVPVEPDIAFGLNLFEFFVDEGDSIQNELSETNNYLPNNIFGSVPLNIISNDVYPIWPYEFAIEGAQSIELNASTANPLAPVKTYLVEIDTTELFNSPLKQQTSITQSGGILKWTPTMTYANSTVYYWRVALDSLQNGDYKWNNTSFIFLDGYAPGWNQSHYYQYLKDAYTNILLPPDREFDFEPSEKVLFARVGLNTSYGGPLSYDEMAFYLNNVLMDKWNTGGCGGDFGMNFAVFDEQTGLPWISVNIGNGNDHGQFGNKHCYGQPDRPSFLFRTISTSGPNNPFPNQNWSSIVQNFIDSVPVGNYILGYSVNKADYENWDATLVSTLSGLGLTAFQPLMIGNNDVPYAFFLQKGNLPTIHEEAGNSISSVLMFNDTFDVEWNQGYITSTVIGPGFNWNTLEWDHHSLDTPNTDEESVDIYGIQYNGTKVLVDSNITQLSHSLTAIDPDQYPYLQLRFDTRDDTNRTPTQLDYWRVIYDKVPEAALNPAVNFTYTANVEGGGDYHFTMAVENVTNVDMDSLLVKYTLIDGSNQQTIFLVREDSLFANTSVNLDFVLNTFDAALNGNFQFIVEINPDNDQPEQFHFNNFAQLSFGVLNDHINPLLDVTFDGVHIMDGDLVSAKPYILIKLKDENQYLALDDTSLVTLHLIDPNGSQKQVHYDGVNTIFNPADPNNISSKNEATVEMREQFPVDGIYKLIVHAEDKAGNRSGNIDYSITFEVINESMISNLLTYPNPFTTQTRFVFTLTGSEVPNDMRIQIMTVSGKIVKEITAAELGDIHVGQNITEFAWDGTDQYGDRLANGLYLYRVVARLNGQDVEHFETSVDKFFERGFGKMYLMR